MALTQPIEDYYPVHPRFYNHDIMHCRLPGIAGEHLFSGRALGISSPYDIVQLHPGLMSEYQAIGEHYDRVGLAYSQQIIWNVNIDEIQHYPEYEASCCCFGEEQNRVVRNENWYGVTDYIRSSRHFIDLANQLGMRTPVTYEFDSSHQLDQDMLARIRFPCYLRAAISVPGTASYRCADPRELMRRLAYFGTDTPFQVQPEPGALTCLSAQYHVSGARLERIAITEKSPDGSIHGGARFPTPHNAWFSVEPMARWLFSQGIRGIFTFDIAVISDACGTDYLPASCVPGFNSASYAILIARKLGVRHWQIRSFDTRHRHIEDLPIQDLEYNHAEQKGVVLVNWGTVLAGTVQFLISGTPQQQQGLGDELQWRL